MVDITASGIKSDISAMISNGTRIRLRYFTESGADANYDNDVTLTQSGSDLWTSGLVQPLNINNPRGSYDAVLLEQGKLLQDDVKMYVLGDVDTSGTFKVGLGSPITREYTTNAGGVTAWQLANGEVAYKKVYLSYLTTGSLPQE